MKRALAALVLASCTGLVAGCGSNAEEETPLPTMSSETAPLSTAPSPETSESETSTTSTTSQTISATSSSTTTSTGKSSSTSTKSSSTSDSAEDAVETVATTFASLAPAAFFDDLENCHPNGIPDSYSCDGPEVGQFQFFASDVKATSTAQVLRELSSSRVVEEQPPRIVGWSVLGSTAIITVVDEKKGLTMQQMISSDKVDPSTRIKELGLVETD